MPLPHKFKIAVGGCPNNCVKPDLNDLGVVGQRVPVPDTGKMPGLQEMSDREELPHPRGQAGGRQDVPSTPMPATTAAGVRASAPSARWRNIGSGYKILIGGRWGKKTACGRPLPRLFTTEEEVMAVIDRAILLFREEGIAGERFADTVTRLGFDYVSGKLLGE